MCDPAHSLPYEILTTILSYLTPPDLGRCALMSSTWHEAANSNYVWETLCDNLWYDKVYVPEEYKAAKRNGFSKQAYIGSLRDSHRGYIKPEELCGYIWNFRFKEAAGEHWLANDPWWKDRRAARVQFSPDGRMLSLDGWPSAHDDTSGRQMERNWTFIPSAAGRQGPKGSFLQINTFPPLIVSRYKNWGFLLQSCWVFYTSFPMPMHGLCPDLEDAALDVTTETMKQEAMRYNIGVEFNLHDHAQILDLLQLLAHIHQPNGFEINFPDVDEDSDGEGNEFEEDDIENEDVDDDGDGDADSENKGAGNAMSDGDNEPYGSHSDVNNFVD